MELDGFSTKFSRRAALRALRRWKRSGKRIWLRRAYRRMLPLLPLVFRQTHLFLPRGVDLEDVLQDASLSLWCGLSRLDVLPWFENESHLNGWADSVVYHMLVNSIRANTTRVPAAPQDVPHAALELRHATNDVAAIENRIFLSELPSALMGRIVRSGRVSSQECPAVQYVLHQLFRGRKPIPHFLREALGIQAARVRFLIDYAIVKLRAELLRIYTDDMSGVIEHPALTVFSHG